MSAAVAFASAFARPTGIVTDPVTYVGAGAMAYGSTSVAPAYPGSLAADDAIFCVVGSKPNTASPQAASGWSLVTTVNGGGGTTGADTGPTVLSVFRKDTVSGSESGTVSFSITSGNSSWGQIVAFRKAAGYRWGIAAATGTDSTTGTTWSVTCGSDPGLSQLDMVLIAGCTPTDVAAGAQFSSHAVTATGATISSVTEIAEASSSTNNDVGGYTARGSVTAGPSSAAPVITATAGGTTTNVRGPGVLVRIRATFPNPAGTFVRLQLRSNVAESGNAATGYIYTRTGSGDYTTTYAGGADISLSGDFEIIFVHATGIPNSGLGTDNTAQASDSWRIGCYAGAPGSDYEFALEGAFGDPADAGFAQAEGDWIRYRRVGSTLTVHASNNSGASWTLIRTLTGWHTGTVYPKNNFNGAASIGPITVT